MLAKLVGSLYGTHDAPLSWQDCLRCQVKLLGFEEPRRVPCVFYHETKDIEMIAHGDDLFVVGGLKDVQDVYRGLAVTFEMKCAYAGPKTGNNEVERLGRRIVFKENRLEIHCDLKHPAILLKETGIENCNPVSSPPC